MDSAAETLSVEQNNIHIDKAREILALPHIPSKQVVPLEERRQRASQEIKKPNPFRNESLTSLSPRAIDKGELLWQGVYELMPQVLRDKRDVIVQHMQEKGVVDPTMAFHHIEAWTQTGLLSLYKNKEEMAKDPFFFNSLTEHYDEILTSPKNIDFIAKASQYPDALIRLTRLGKSISFKQLEESQIQPIVDVLSQLQELPQKNFDRALTQLKKYPFLLPRLPFQEANKEVLQITGVGEVLKRGGFTKEEEAVLPIAKDLSELHGFRSKQHPILGQLSVSRMAEEAGSLQKEWVVWQQLVFEALQKGEGKYNPNEFLDVLKKDGNAGAKIQELIKLGTLDDLSTLVEDGWAFGKNTLDLFAQTDRSVSRLAQDIRQAIKLKDQLKNPQLQQKIAFITDLYPDSFQTTAGTLPIDIVPFLTDKNIQLLEDLAEITKSLEDTPEKRKQLLVSFIKPDKYVGIKVDYDAINNVLTSEKTSQLPEDKRVYWETWKNMYAKKSQYSSREESFKIFTDFLTRSATTIPPLLKEGKFTIHFYSEFNNYLADLPSYYEFQVKRDYEHGPEKISTHTRWLLDKDFVPTEIKAISDIYMEGQNEFRSRTAEIISSDLVQTVSEFQQGKFWGKLLEKLITSPRPLSSSYGLGEAMKYLENPDVLKALDPVELQFWSKWNSLSMSIRYIIGQNLSAIGGINEKNAQRLETVGEISTRLDNSSSKEMQKLKDQILGQILQTENPAQSFEQIEAIFERNHLPTVGKIYRVFELLYSPQKIDEMLKEKSKDDKSVSYSPTLEAASARRRSFTIYHDLLKIHVESGNPSLYGYLKTLQEGEVIFDAVSTGNLDSLNDAQRRQLTRFLDNLDALYKSSTLGQRSQTNGNTQSIEERIQAVKKNFGVEDNQKLTDRVVTMFASPLGYASIEQTLEWMETVRQKTHYRNVTTAQEAITNNGNIAINPGDLLKGVDDDFLDLILKNGSVAREYLGAAAGSDKTPFDTDVSLVLPKDESKSFKEKVESSLANIYGELKFLIKNRGQFISDQSSPSSQSKYELFPTEYLGERHYGIRTGIPATEIDCMIVNGNLAKDIQELARVYFTIAQNGYYIPVVNEDGKVIFTPDDYEKYRVGSDEVKNVLESDNHAPEALIGALKKNPYLKALFEGQTGVSEGYSLEEHTTMVMTQFEKYFPDTWAKHLLDRNHFRVLLALHDLGKPLAVNKTGNTAAQHEYTMKFAPQILNSLNLDPKQTDTMLTIIDQDILGELFQGKIDMSKASHEVSNKAKSLGLSPDELLGMLTVYYMCDASSYTTDAGGKESLDSLFIFPPVGSNEPIRLSAPLEEKLLTLQNSLPSQN